MLAIVAVRFARLPIKTVLSWFSIYEINFPSELAGTVIFVVNKLAVDTIFDNAHIFPRDFYEIRHLKLQITLRNRLSCAVT